MGSETTERARPFTIEALERRTLLNCDPSLIGAVPDAWMRTRLRQTGQTVVDSLRRVQDLVFDRALAQPLPLIGAPLKGLKATYLDKLQSLIDRTAGVTAQPSEQSLCEIAGKLEVALGPTGLNAQVRARVVDPPAWRPGQPIVDAMFELRLSGHVIEQIFEPNVDLGVPALALKLQGGVRARLEYDIRLNVGIDPQNWYLDVSPTGDDPEVELRLVVEAPGQILPGSIGFLRAIATDNGTRLNAEFSIDLKDEPDHDDKLYSTEIGFPLLPPAVWVSGHAHVDFLLSCDTSTDLFPALRANLVVDWPFPRTNVNAAETTLRAFGVVPTVQFRDVQLDLGKALKVLTNFLRTLHGNTSLLRSFVLAMRQTVPLLSDFQVLRERFDRDPQGQSGHGQVSLLEALQALHPSDSLTKFVRAVDGIDRIIGAGQALNSTDGVIRFGTFTIVGDPRTITREILQDPARGVISFDDTPVSELPPEMATVIGQLKDEETFGGGDYGFRFPFLDQKATLFGIFLGQPVDLVTYKFPGFSINPPFDETLPILWPVSVKLKGSVGVRAGLSFGLDTFGLATWAANLFRDPDQIMNGFYVSDRANADGTGADVDELVLDASVAAEISLDVGVASATAGGGISGTARLNFNDPNNDGRVRANEFRDLTTHNPLCSFEGSGRVVAGLHVSGHVGVAPAVVTFNHRSNDAEIVNFNHECGEPSPTPLPDLVAHALRLTAPNAANPRLRRFELDVANPGAAAAAASRATLFLSDDPTVTAADTPLHVIDLVALAQAQTRTLTGQFTLPNNPFATDNQYYLGVVVDPDGAVAESDEANNLGSGTAPYTFSVEADLPTPSPASAGQVQVRATALALDTPVGASLADEIIGPSDVDVYRFTIPADFPRAFAGLDVDAPAGVNTYLRLYDAQWQLIDFSDDDPSPSENVNRGESYLRVAAVPGTYYAAVSASGNSAADPRLLAGRAAPAFGHGPYVITLLSDPTALPDLVPVAMTRTTRADSSFHYVRLTIRNEGRADAGPFHVYFYVSDDPDISTSDVFAASAFVAGLGAGQQVVVDAGADLGAIFGPDDPFRTDNDYYLGAVVNHHPASPPIREAKYYNNSNRGADVDRVRIISEADLPSPPDGAVVSRPIPPYAPGGFLSMSDIGDEYIGRYDLDVYHFNITAAGQTAQIDIDPRTTRVDPIADSYLRLYDAEWRLLASNDDGRAPDDPVGSPAGSYVSHLFARPGTYYAVVSSPANAGADPRTLAGRAPGPEGGYAIALMVYPDIGSYMNLGFQSFQLLSPPWVGVHQAQVVLFNEDGPPANHFEVHYYLSDDAAASPEDVLLKTTAVAGMPAGTLLTLSEQFTLPHTPILSDNEYYLVAVIEPDDRVHERQVALDADFNLNNAAAVRVSAEYHLPSPATGAVVVNPLTHGVPQISNVGWDEWAGSYDLDAFAFTAERGQTLGVDIDKTRLMENLDSFLRLYDANWNLLAANDNGRSPDDPPRDRMGANDSYLDYTFATAGTYFAVVGSSDAAANDPRRLDGRRAGSTRGEYFITVREVAGSSIYGDVYDDANASGRPDRREAGLAGVTVYLDANRNGVFDPGEPATSTNALGQFAFGRLGPGEYAVRHVPPERSSTTAPHGGTANVLIPEGQVTSVHVTFGDAPLLAVTGHSFDDVDANGQQRGEGESGLAGRVVYADVNRNGTADAGEPQAVTDASGNFELLLLPVDHLIRQLLPTGWRGTAPEGGAYGVRLDRGGEIPRLLFGSTRTFSLSGSVFEDLDADGGWDADEPAVAGRQVFADVDADGARGAAEPAAVTNSDGQWRLDGLLPGSYGIIQVTPADWLATAPTGSGVHRLRLEVRPDDATGRTTSGLDFGTRFAGAAVAPAGRLVFFNNSAFDGRDAAVTPADDGAIARGKAALLPGQSASVANVTGDARGINGVMIDVGQLPAHGLRAEDLVFHTSTVGPGSAVSWSPAPAPIGIGIRRGAGANGADRVTVAFPDGAIRNQWLRVTVLANGRTGLASPDVFYFGNLVGETGDRAFGGRLVVNALDVVRTRRAISSNAASDSPYDFNRDGRVSPIDLAIVRSAMAQRRSLALLNAPPVIPAAPPPLAASRADAADDEEPRGLLA